MKKMTKDYAALIIGSKRYLKVIQPFLSAYFEGRKYIFCDEYDVLYDVGRWTSRKILKFCAKKNIGQIVFVTLIDNTFPVTMKLRDFQGLTGFIPMHAYPEITSVETLKKAIQPFDISKPCLEYMEFHINDHCNLNCKGCSHYSNLFSEPHFANLNQFVSDMQKLKKLFWNVGRIRVLGGEPLLSPKLPEFLDVIRETFPSTDLRIASNGLLIPKISDELVRQMKETHTGFDIVNYPPTNMMRQKILDKVISDKIDCCYDTSEIKFRKRLMKNPSNDEYGAYCGCKTRFCHFLRAGTISLCPILALSYKFNATFGTQYPVDGIHVLADFTDGWELYDILKKPVPLCRYCSPIFEYYEWDVSSKKDPHVEDWVIDDATVLRLKQEMEKQEKEKQQSLWKHPRVALRRHLEKHEKLVNRIDHLYHKYYLQNFQNPP